MVSSSSSSGNGVGGHGVCNTYATLPHRSLVAGVRSVEIFTEMLDENYLSKACFFYFRSIPAGDHPGSSGGVGQLGAPSSVAPSYMHSSNNDILDVAANSDLNPIIGKYFLS